MRSGTIQRMGHNEPCLNNEDLAAGKEVTKLPKGVVVSSRGNVASVLVDGVFALFMVTEAEAEAYVASLRELDSLDAAALQAA